MRLGDLGQSMIGASLFVERLLQQPRFVEPVEPARVRAGATVGGNFVMLDPLGRADNRRVARIVCCGLIQTFVGFLNNPREARARLRAARLAPVRENQFEPLEVEPRFIAVFLECFSQYRGTGGFREARQRLDHLRFRIVEIADLIEVHVLQRGDRH